MVINEIAGLLSTLAKLPGLIYHQKVVSLPFGGLASRRPWHTFAENPLSHNLKRTIRSVCLVPVFNYVALESKTANHAKRTFR